LFDSSRGFDYIRASVVDDSSLKALGSRFVPITIEISIIIVIIKLLAYSILHFALI
jgi:hypothetical protein